MATCKQMEASAKDVWKRYWKTRAVADRNALVEIYRPLLAVWARKINLPDWAELDQDDLQSAGCFGLIDAIGSFKPSRGTAFSSFCGLRIRGAMLDHVRHMDWVPRQVRQLQKRGEAEPVRLIRLQQLQANREDETDREMEIADPRIPSPSQRMENESWWQEMLQHCNQRDRLMLLLLYKEGLNMRQVGLQLQISESRVSQLHSMLLAQARTRIQTSDASNSSCPSPPQQHWNHLMNKKSAITLPATILPSAESPDELSIATFLQQLNRNEVQKRIEHHRRELAAWQELLLVVQIRESEGSARTRRRDTPNRIEQLLKDKGGMRPKEIADKLGLSAANVHACLKRNVDRFSKTSEGLWEVG